MGRNNACRCCEVCGDTWLFQGKKAHVPLEIRCVLWGEGDQGQGPEGGWSCKRGKGELQKGRKKTTKEYIWKTVVKAPYSNIVS